MGRLIAAEVVKLTATRLWLWLLLASMAITALYASLVIGFGDNPDNPNAALASAEGQRLVFAVAQGASTLLVVLAAIGVTGEFRHRTASGTFLATPHRSRVVLAKAVTYAVVGALYGVVCFAVVAAIAVPWLSSRGVDVSLTGNGIPGVLGGIVVGTAIFGVIGVALGALLRDQVATVVGLLVYLFVVEPIVTRIPALGEWTRFLPGAAEDALTQFTQAGANLLTPWQGGLALAGYALVLAIVGTLVLARRDIA